MKYVILILALLALIFTAAQAYVLNDLKKTEEQSYSVVWKNDQIEARFYPEAVLATVTSPATTYRSSSNRNFRVLAGYIFGGNEENQSIPMTSPVHMSFENGTSEMSFVMPSSMNLETLPKPNTEGIIFSKSKEMYAVAIRFSGWADDEKIKNHTNKLLRALDVLGIEPKSSPWFMGYNPPYQVVNRRNEVAVEISKGDLELLKAL